MRLCRLRAENLRLFAALSVDADAGLNFVTGDNGAGKTSVLEAISLLASGRSFRGGSREALIRHGSTRCLIHAELSSETSTHSLGLGRGPRSWEGRVDGAPIGALVDLYRYCPALFFHPESHGLIAGGSEGRRRFLDWALFHVEPEFLEQWRRYQRALRQRTTALASGESTGSIDAWEVEMARWAVLIDSGRRRAIDGIDAALLNITAELFPEPGEAVLRYRPGWSGEPAALVERLRESRSRDQQRGYASVGPHRAGWSIGFADLPHRDLFSRGQQKLTALCLLLAQMSYVRSAARTAPIFCIDDLAAELDEIRQQRVLRYLLRSDAQVWIAATAAPETWADSLRNAAVFHVEQGRVERQL